MASVFTTSRALLFILLKIAFVLLLLFLFGENRLSSSSISSLVMVTVGRDVFAYSGLFSSDFFLINLSLRAKRLRFKNSVLIDSEAYVYYVGEFG